MAAVDQQSVRKVAVGLLESTKEEEMTMMCMYDQKIGEGELQGVGVDDWALCFVDDFDCDTTTCRAPRGSVAAMDDWFSTLNK